MSGRFIRKDITMDNVIANAMLGTPIKWCPLGAEVRHPVAWALTPQGVGCMAYHQRYQGVTLAQVLSVAESEDELWAIADGWCEAAGCDAYTSEMIEELGQVRMAEDREGWVGI